MDTADRAHIDYLVRERAKLTTPAERIAFDNDPANGPVALRIVAMTEHRDQRELSSDRHLRETVSGMVETREDGYELVAWHGSGSAQLRIGKAHLREPREQVTLCGLALPKPSKRVWPDNTWTTGVCVRCERAATKLGSCVPS